eukprot:3010940-Rhodomonas_salina.1
MARSSKLKVGEGPPFSEGGRGDIHCAACLDSVDPDYIFTCDKCKHVMCEDCALDVLELEDRRPEDQAETQANQQNMPEYCGGPQIQCMSPFPQAVGRGRGRGKKSAVGSGEGGSQTGSGRGRWRGRPRGGGAANSQTM